MPKKVITLTAQKTNKVSHGHSVYVLNCDEKCEYIGSENCYHGKEFPLDKIENGLGLCANSADSYRFVSDISVKLVRSGKVKSSKVDWASRFNKDLEKFAQIITPEVAYHLSNSYAEAAINENKEQRVKFFGTLKEGMHLSDDVVAKLLEDSEDGKKGTETSIICTLEHLTKNPEAKGAVKAINTAVYNVLRSSGRT